MTWIQTILTFLIGYVLGYMVTRPESMQEVGKSMQSLARKLKKQKLGAVKRLTPTEQTIRNNPTLKEEEEEMTRVLDDVL